MLSHSTFKVLPTCPTNCLDRSRLTFRRLVQCMSYQTAGKSYLCYMYIKLNQTSTADKFSTKQYTADVTTCVDLSKLLGGGTGSGQSAITDDIMDLSGVT